MGQQIFKAPLNPGVNAWAREKMVFIGLNSLAMID